MTAWTFSAMAAADPDYDPLVAYPHCSHCRHRSRGRSHLEPCLRIDDEGAPCPGATPERRRAA